MEVPDFETIWANRKIPVVKDNPAHFQYATYIKDRRPNFKIHRTLGHAHSAIACKYYPHRGATCDMALYHKEDDKWVPIEAWAYGDKARPSWWEPIPDPAIAALQKRKNRFLDAFAVMVGVFQDPNVSLEEINGYHREILRLQKELNPVAKRLANERHDHGNE